MKACILSIGLVVLLYAGGTLADDFGTGANRFTIDFVAISGHTNPASGRGIVENAYRIGVYEVTNDQWNKFKAAYGPVTGNPTSAYDAEPSWTGASIPTTKASWYEAAQFVNWLNTSTGHHAAYKFTGTRGTANYALSVWTPSEADGGANLYRHKDAYYFLPTEDEWLKAAYWNGTSLQSYSNASAGDLVSGLPDLQKWNYSPSSGSAPWIVGSGVMEVNGTYDMMGNVWEWAESPDSDPNYGTASSRAHLGGSYLTSQANLISSAGGNYDPNTEAVSTGFRVASVPEPATLSLLGLGGLAVLRRRRTA